MRTIIVLLLLCISSVAFTPAHAEVSIEQQLLPAYLIDHIGFTIDKDPFAVAGMNADAPIFPAFPLYKSKAMGKKFIGAKIPREYLEGRSVKAAAEMLQEVVLEGGRRLVPYYHRGELYGIRDDIMVANVNQTTIGLSLSFGPEMVNLGDEFVIGFNLHLGGLHTKLGSSNGLNLANSFQDLYDLSKLSFTGESAETLVKQSLAFYPYIAIALAANASEKLTIKSTENDPRFQGTTRVELQLPEPVPPSLSLQTPVDRTKYSPELQDALNKLNDQSVIKRETEWRKEMSGAANYTSITKAVRDQEFIQKICNHIAEAYELPREVWPTCRISASLQPNAWAYPGGDIFFTAGMLGILSDLDSMILVLGHEIGHVVGRHGTKRMPMINALNYTANGVSIAASVFALGAGWGNFGSVSFLNWFPKGMVLGQVQSLGLNLMVQTGVAGLMAHSRAHERQADRFGQQTAFAAGANLSAMTKGWSEFSSYIKKHLGADDDLLSRIMASHPNTEERLEGISERSADIEASLESWNKANRLPEEYYAEYRAIHESYKPASEWFGKRLQEKKNSKSRSHALSTLLTPGGMCALEALTH
jgi:Zn-dependent protease with chaperone function